MTDAEFTRIQQQLVAFKNQRDSLAYQIAAMDSAIEAEKQRRADVVQERTSVRIRISEFEGSGQPIGYITATREDDENLYTITYVEPVTRSSVVLGSCDELEPAKLALRFWWQMRQSEIHTSTLEMQLSRERRALEKCRALSLPTEIRNAILWRQGAIIRLQRTIDTEGYW